MTFLILPVSTAPIVNSRVYFLKNNENASCFARCSDGALARKPRIPHAHLTFRTFDSRRHDHSSRLLAPSRAHMRATALVCLLWTTDESSAMPLRRRAARPSSAHAAAQQVNNTHIVIGGSQTWGSDSP
eukprot:SAG31_NODE_24244_length_486_cov_0.684755_1_plen_128_part_01